jgi:hypothetical protein
MVKISICALIYKSTVYADFIYRQVNKYTPMLHTGEAEFYFVANDASEEVLQHLERMKYRYIRNDNEHLSEEELFKKGIGCPEYINRVYKGWNRCIMEAKGEYVCLVNSDMAFSPNWLENLYCYVNEHTAVSSLLIERGHETLGHFSDSFNGTGSIVYYCGKTPLNYDEDRFQKYVFDRNNDISNKDKVTNGGVYMPILFNKNKALQAGLYPEGNIAGNSFKHVIASGDTVFMTKLKQIGVNHITSWNSIVYHFQQGEMEF